MISKIDYLTISDVHLGHRRNKAKDIISNLDHYFDHYKSTSQFSQLDIIFIAGDLFDQLLEFSNDDIHEAALWLSRLMSFCSRFRIKLRILEGTPSHDWKQSKIANTIVAMATMIGMELDFKYVDTLLIEYIEDLDIHVLYIPDEYSSDTSITFDHVKQLLAENHLGQVDIGIFHGMFHYQLKNVPGTHHKHSEADYLGIVRYFINIGHIHSFSVYDRIIAQGSFDRMSHGEEEPKGGVVCHLRADGNNSFDFVENIRAKIFKTIEVRYLDLDKALAHVDKHVKGLPLDSYVRIKAKKDHPLYIAFDQLKLRHLEYNFSKSDIDEEPVGQIAPIDLVQVEEQYVAITITNNNIVELLSEAVVNKYALNDKQRQILSSTLEGNK